MHTPFLSNNFLQFEFCPEPASYVGAVDDVDISDTEAGEYDDIIDLDPKLYDWDLAHHPDAGLRPLLHQANITFYNT